KIDDFVIKTGLRVPEETLPALKDGYALQERSELDLEGANITGVVWATGYSFDFSLVRFPILDSDGYPIQERGITKYKGLYFVGLAWLHNAKSGLLFGLAQDASHIARAINDDTRHRRRNPKQFSSAPKEHLAVGPQCYASSL